MTPSGWGLYSIPPRSAPPWHPWRQEHQTRRTSPAKQYKPDQIDVIARSVEGLERMVGEAMSEQAKASIREIEQEIERNGAIGGHSVEQDVTRDAFEKGLSYDYVGICRLISAMYDR